MLEKASTDGVRSLPTFLIMGRDPDAAKTDWIRAISGEKPNCLIGLVELLLNSGHDYIIVICDLLVGGGNTQKHSVQVTYINTRVVDMILRWP